MALNHKSLPFRQRIIWVAVKTTCLGLPMLHELRDGTIFYWWLSFFFQCVKALVYYDVRSCRLDTGNEKGDTPLHIAARWGYQGIIEVLLQNGANPDIQNRMKETSLQCALNSKVLLFIFQLEFFLMQFHRHVDAYLLTGFCGLVWIK